MTIRNEEVTCKGCGVTGRAGLAMELAERVPHLLTDQGFSCRACGAEHLTVTRVKWTAPVSQDEAQDVTAS